MLDPIRHSGDSVMGLTAAGPSVAASTSLRRYFALFGNGANLTWSCLDTSREITTAGWTGTMRMPAGILMLWYRSSSARARSSSSETKELAGPWWAPFALLSGDARESRFGQQGYAQLAEEVPMSAVIVLGEREEVAGLTAAGEIPDFGEILMGFTDEDAGSELLLVEGIWNDERYIVVRWFDEVMRMQMRVGIWKIYGSVLVGRSYEGGDLENIY